MAKDILFLLKADFEDKAYPGTRFVCPYCTFFEGLLSVFPKLESQIEVQRIGFERPRKALIPYVGQTINPAQLWSWVRALTKPKRRGEMGILPLSKAKKRSRIICP